MVLIVLVAAAIGVIGPQLTKAREATIESTTLTIKEKRVSAVQTKCLLIVEHVFLAQSGKKTLKVLQLVVPKSLFDQVSYGMTKTVPGQYVFDPDKETIDEWRPQSATP